MARRWTKKRETSEEPRQAKHLHRPSTDRFESGQQARTIVSRSVYTVAASAHKEVKTSEVNDIRGKENKHSPQRMMQPKKVEATRSFALYLRLKLTVEAVLHLEAMIAALGTGGHGVVGVFLVVLPFQGGRLIGGAIAISVS